MNIKNYLLFFIIILFNYEGHSQDVLFKLVKGIPSNMQRSLRDCANGGPEAFDFEVSGLSDLSSLHQILIDLENDDDNLPHTLQLSLRTPSGTVIHNLYNSEGNWDNVPNKQSYLLVVRDCDNVPLNSADVTGIDNDIFLTRTFNTWAAFAGEDLNGTWQVGICSNNPNMKISRLDLHFESKKPHAKKIVITDATTCTKNDGSFSFSLASGLCNFLENGRYKLNNESSWSTYVPNTGGVTYDNLVPGTYELTVAMAPDGVNVDPSSVYIQNIVIGASSGSMMLTCQADLSKEKGDIVAITPPNYCGPTLTQHQYYIIFPDKSEVGPFQYDAKESTTYSYTELGVYEILWQLRTANDFKDCTQYISIFPADPCTNDVTKPVLDNCPVDFSENLIANEIFAEPVYRIPVSNDNCKVASRSLTVNLTGGSTFENGTTSFTWTTQLDPGKRYRFTIHNKGVATFNYKVIDDAGNIVDCKTKITILDQGNPCDNDVTKPVLTDCPQDKLQTLGQNETRTTIAYQIPLQTDNCNIATWSLKITLTEGSTFNDGKTELQWTNVLTPGTNYGFDVNNDGFATFNYKVIDDAGNVAECTTVVTVGDPNDPCKNDVTAPVLINCPGNQAIVLEDNNEGSFVVTNPTVSDNCLVTSMRLKVTLTGGATFQSGATEWMLNELLGKSYRYPVRGKGVVNFEYEIKDAAGNITKCTSQVQLLLKDGPCNNDVISPKVTSCPDDKILILNNGKATTPIVVPDFFDNCAVTDIKAIYTYYDGATHQSGTTSKVITGLSGGRVGKIDIIGSGRATIEFIAVDPSGNEGSCIVEYRSVQAGSNVLFNIASQCAVPEQNTSLSVTVSRFNSIGAFSFDLQVPPGSGLSFVDIENTTLQNLSSNVLGNGDLRISWDDPNGADVSLEDNFRIFDIVLRASTNFTQASSISGKDVAILSSVNDNGSVSTTEICVGSSVTPSGKILNPRSKVHQGVDVRLLSGGKTIDTKSTSVQGTFTFEKTHDTYRIEPYKNDQIRLGINIIDVAKIRRHFLQTTLLTNNYDIVAADVNKDGRINVLDVAYSNRVLLRKRDNFPNNTSWRFIPKAFDLSSNPLDPNIPTSIKLNTTHLDYTKLDFVSIKVGDVDHSALGKFKDDKINSRSAGLVSIPDTIVVASDNIEIPVYVSGDEKISLFSMKMKYDNSLLKLVGINSETIESFSGGNYNDLGGEVLIAWDHPKGADFTGSGVLMTLVFEGLSMEGISDITMEDVMFFDKEFTNIDFNVVGGKVQLMPTAVNDLSNNVSISASPNPFKNNINIDVLTSTAQEVNLIFRDLSGNVIKEVYSTSRNTTHHFNIDDIEYRGVIMVTIRGKDFVKTLRVIKL